jgi:hypothetical protein
MSERSKEGKTMEKMDKLTFKWVRCAIELNRDETGDIYYHPSEKRIVLKCIDLSCNKPLTEVHTAENKPKSRSAERWLEAYLIWRARRNCWILELANERRFRFLYSQLKFPQEGIKKARPLDLLLYEQEIGHLVVMELKAARVLGKAKDELDDYVTRVDELKDKIADVFKLGQISGVKGYIVWPENERPANKKHDFGKHGLIEYTSPHGIIKNGKLVEPWEQFKKLGESLAIEFVFKDLK